MVAPVRFDPKILPKGPAKLRWVGPEFGPEGKQFVSGNSYFWGMYKKQRSCNGQGGAQRPVRHDNKPRKTGARGARARTRGQNPLVYKILSYTIFNLVKYRLLQLISTFVTFFAIIFSRKLLEKTKMYLKNFSYSLMLLLFMHI